MPHEVETPILFQLSLNLRGQTQLGVSRPVWTKPLAFNRAQAALSSAVEKGVVEKGMGHAFSPEDGLVG